MAFGNPGAWHVLQNIQREGLSAEAIKVLSLPIDDVVHTKWQAFVLDGMVVESVKEARALGLDLPTAYALVNEFRKQEGLMPPKPKRWWWPFN